MGTLVLERRPGQAIRIGSEIEVMVVRVRGDAVRLGVRAPRDMDIVRDDAIVQTRKQTED